MTDELEATRENLRELRASIDDLGRKLDRSEATMGLFAPRHDVDEQITRRVEGLGLEVEDKLAELHDAVVDARTAATLATDAAEQINAYTKARIRRFREFGRLALVGSLAAACFAVVVATVSIDLHLHRAHINPVELRLAAIEDHLPDLELTGHVATAGGLPMFPSREQVGRPVGVYFLGSAVVALVVFASWTVWLWVRGFRRLASE